MTKVEFTISNHTITNTIKQEKAPKFDWKELRKRREELSDIHPLTTKEICEIVREVRRGNTQ
ncbi:hypothetical protein H6G54_02350 [Anabaena cylindrica FACHB-243]|uniref:Uncharacterized protein n=1 Tax=Anabaena cylindrica (strain ATCC 27899 / PCC 7122) TaxID=272123 RepID=K9ZKD6_ANACC|nr:MULTISPECIES: hypothetical protein [Anabaena]AFZ59219.1 hypothetical protein Anacy_3841 [Anabaena cylindrica PCC 7122]MBD2416569.1 hypothetical protein [Anabaena cylindrica FACHB-243]MBY5280932.1 hypothetical protein [Anabaena sp. CCAP 1446/1C]MBY5310563.1 hypothetical protein [Anabaena sp. CCAP 1446/1C]MCM2407509.1 hypothetical protein [Anabaena sp. CCAP 1446/1C]